MQCSTCTSKQVASATQPPLQELLIQLYETMFLISEAQVCQLNPLLLEIHATRGGASRQTSGHAWLLPNPVVKFAIK